MAKKRDPKVVERFLKKEGLKKLQLLTKKQHSDKTAREARARDKKK